MANDAENYPWVTGQPLTADILNPLASDVLSFKSGVTPSLPFATTFSDGVLLNLWETKVENAQETYSEYMWYAMQLAVTSSVGDAAIEAGAPVTAQIPNATSTSILVASTTDMVIQSTRISSPQPTSSITAASSATNFTAVTDTMLVCSTSASDPVGGQRQESTTIAVSTVISVVAVVVLLLLVFRKQRGSDARSSWQACSNRSRSPDYNAQPLDPNQSIKRWSGSILSFVKHRRELSGETQVSELPGDCSQDLEAQNYASHAYHLEGQVPIAEAESIQPYARALPVKVQEALCFPGPITEEECRPPGHRRVESLDAI